MRTLVLAVSAALLLAGSEAAAQQLESNDAGGTLTRAGDHPVIGQPFIVSTSGLLQVDVAGGPAAGVILVLGQLAQVSTVIPGTEYFDLDLGGPTVLLVDGINGGGALFPYLTLGATNVNGAFGMDFSMSAANQGGTYAFQAVVADVLSPFGLNFTAAAEYHVAAAVNPPQSVSADDLLLTYTTANPVCFAGGVHNVVQVDTNGFMRFATTGNSDYTESASDMSAGTVGGSPAAPAIAMLWDDLRTDIGIGSDLTVLEVAPGVVQAQWNNVAYFGSGAILGSMVLTVDTSSGAALVTFDHTGMNYPAGSNKGIVGISAGLASATVSVGDLVSSGTVNLLGGAAGPNTLYEDFNASGSVDLGGVVVSAVDGACDATFITF